MKKTSQKHFRRLTAILLALTLLFSLALPFDLTAYAEEEPIGSAAVMP